jgi:hypothetical protein
MMTFLTIIDSDDILIRKFPCLQRVGIQVKWEICAGHSFPDEKDVRLVMPGPEKMGILELVLSVRIGNAPSDVGTFE